MREGGLLLDDSPLRPDKPEPAAASIARGHRPPEPRADISDTLAGLVQNIVSLLPRLKCRTVQFVGTSSGEGTSTVARECARTAALKLGKSVLLLDAGHNGPGQAAYFELGKPMSWEKAVQEGRSIRESFCRVDRTSLFVSHIAMDSAPGKPLFDLPHIHFFLEELKQDFDFILIDSPAASKYPTSLLLSNMVNGVVLIVEAEKTRWQVVDQMKKKIENQGGNILGVVLNKRRYPIPDAIYKRI